MVSSKITSIVTAGLRGDGPTTREIRPSPFANVSNASAIAH